MRFLQNKTIRQKLIIIIMAACVISLVLTGLAFIGWKWTNVRKQMVSSLSTHSKMIGYNCKAALTFEDAKSAKETLGSLRTEESIIYGCILDTEGEVFATYHRDEANKSEFLIVPEERGYYFGNKSLTVLTPITLDGKEIGRVCLFSDLQPLYKAIKDDVYIMIIIVSIICVLAYFISINLQKVISGPILNLTDVAREVSEKRVYSTRAVKQSNDEIGLLIEAFNEMLEQIQQRDSELVGSRKQLEIKVKERTEELSSANVKLAEEVAERSSAQRKLGDRIKEIVCLYETSKLFGQSEINIEQVFQQSTEMLRKAYKEPELTAVKITFDGIKYTTDNFETSEITQFTEIKIWNENVGDIYVYYLGENPERGQSPFLKEEKELLDAVAVNIARMAERKQSEAKIKETEEQFRKIFDTVTDAILVFDANGYIVNVNSSASEIYGYQKEEMIGLTGRDIVHPDYYYLFEQFQKQLQETGKFHAESVDIRKDGTAFNNEVTGSTFLYKNEMHLLALVRNTTERKRAEERQAKLLEQLESANEELKSFAYVVSHDLKAPLRGIKTLAEWMVSDYADQLDDDGKEKIKMLSSRVDRMHNLINGILQYSRIGRIQEDRVMINLNELVAKSIDLLAAPENITITIEDELPTIECEETRMTQLFQNLLSNAIKYMDKPEGLIKVGCVEEDDFWKFSVADNGPGIEEKYFNKIFEMFQTLSARDKFESTGVGLTLIKKIVVLYGGNIWVESEMGSGSTFFFTLPKKEKGAVNYEQQKTHITC